MADGRVVIDTSLNNKGFTRGVSNLKGELGGLTSVVKKLGAVIGVAFGVKALVDFSKKAIELGSSVAEVQNVVDVAFGDMAYKIEDFAKTSIQNFGMSRLAAKKTASTYMAMARGMGINEQAASDMAISLTGLSGDVASFFNISQELADVKLKSVFTGETETLKDLGVVMTQANLKAYARSQGISKDVEKMSQAELVGLRYNFVLDQLALAHGDFARTSDSWANQTRVLSMQWEEFMSIMGQALITVFTPLVKVLNEMVASLIEAATAINQVMTALFGGEQAQANMKENAEGTDSAIQGSVEGQGELTDSIKQTEKEQKKSLALFDDINKIGDNKKTGAAETPQSPTGPAQTPATEQVEGLAERFKGLVESLRQGFDEIAGFARRIWSVFSEAWAQSGQSVIDAAKSAFGSILELVRSIGTAFAEVWTNGAGEQLLQNVLSIISGVLEFVRQLADQMKQVWDEMGAKLGEAFFYALNSILELIKSIGAAFASVWNSGVGTEILSTIMSILTNIFDLVGTLANRMREAWEANGNGVAIWQSILNVVQQVLSFVDRVVQATVSWAQGLNLGPIVTAFRNLLSAVEPLAAVILDSLAWAYESVLLPLASWVIEDAAPAALDLLSSAIEALTPVIEALRPLATWLWDSFLQPIGQWAGDIIIQAIEWLTEKLRAFGDWASEHKEVIETVAIIIGSFLAAWAAATAVSGIIAGVTAALTALASAGGLVTIATTAFAAAVNFLQSPIVIITLAIGALIAIIVLLVKNWDKVKAAAGAAWDFIVSTWQAAGEWITTNVLDPVVNAFKTAINFILGIVEGFVNFFVGGINAIINGLNCISFDVPDWVPLIGGKTFGFDIPNVPELQIPRLAQGAVIPANREFLAVLGDQKSGTNIEAPLSTIEEALGKALDQRGGGAQEVSVTVRFDGSLAQLARVLKPHIDVEGARKGAHLVKGGAF